ncbi:hypothetical protein SBF1_610018 [Candidatus Desulfosporosinus infrequens]|uniref:Uncharacterized protein n=1 Tax=Candidatus Desulfosporosinus infrequens TaxID=2043169 RepID=A0A2U3LLE2_9FIRM|nr:hypothetical protein SBF1_610018 [Candidatus Desulfosporosinus infrequens]
MYNPVSLELHRRYENNLIGMFINEKSIFLNLNRGDLPIHGNLFMAVSDVQNSTDPRYYTKSVTTKDRGW